MAVIFICDGCKKEDPGQFNEFSRRQEKPDQWFRSADQDGERLACSRECIEGIFRTTGKSRLVTTGVREKNDGETWK